MSEETQEPTEVKVVLRPWLAERLTKLRAEMAVVDQAYDLVSGIKNDAIVQPVSTDRSAHRSYEDVKRSLREKADRIEKQIGEILTEGLHAATKAAQS